MMTNLMQALEMIEEEESEEGESLPSGPSAKEEKPHHDKTWEMRHEIQFLMYRLPIAAAGLETNMVCAVDLKKGLQGYLNTILLRKFPFDAQPEDYLRLMNLARFALMNRPRCGVPSEDLPELGRKPVVIYRGRIPGERNPEPVSMSVFTSGRSKTLQVISGSNLEKRIFREFYNLRR